MSTNNEQPGSMAIAAVAVGGVPKKDPTAREHVDGTQATSVDGMETRLPVELGRFRLESFSSSSAPASIRLDMQRQSITLPAITALAEYMSLLNTPLISINLSGNDLGPRGAGLLGRALVTNNTLQFLELDDCGLTGSPYRPDFDGIRTLAKGFESSRSTLRFLSIAGNYLQPDGCRVLLGALAFHPTLTALDVSDNMLSLFNDKQGYLALSYLLRFSKRLCWLGTDANPLPTGASAALQQSLLASPTLTALSARGSTLTLPPQALE